MLVPVVMVNGRLIRVEVMRKYYTKADLKKSHACEGGRRKFSNAFPKGKVAMTRKNMEHFVLRTKHPDDQYTNAVQASIYLTVMLIAKGLITNSQIKRLKAQRGKIMGADYDFIGNFSAHRRKQAHQIVDALVATYKLRWE